MFKALFVAWEKPPFRNALWALINLAETRRLLSAMATGRRRKRRLGELVRSALDTPQIRGALLLLLNDADFRRSAMTAIAATVPKRQTLARSLASALSDPEVRREIGQALQSDSTRSAISDVADNQLRDRKVRLVLSVAGLLLHHSVRRLLGDLRRHGVLREIRA